MAPPLPHEDARPRDAVELDGRRVRLPAPPGAGGGGAGGGPVVAVRLEGEGPTDPAALAAVAAIGAAALHVVARPRD